MKTGYPWKPHAKINFYVSERVCERIHSKLFGCVLSFIGIVYVLWCIMSFTGDFTLSHDSSQEWVILCCVLHTLHPLSVNVHSIKKVPCIKKIITWFTRGKLLPLQSSNFKHSILHVSSTTQIISVLNFQPTNTQKVLGLCLGYNQTF